MRCVRDLVVLVVVLVLASVGITVLHREVALVVGKDALNVVALLVRGTMDG